MRCYCETITFNDRLVPGLNIVPENEADVAALSALATTSDTVFVDDSGNAHCLLSVVILNSEIQAFLKKDITGKKETELDLGPGTGPSADDSGLPANPGLKSE